MSFVGDRRRPSRRAIEEVIPDVRDGLTRPERVVLWVLSETQKELRGRSVPTAMLYGRVVEHLDMSPAQLIAILQRLGAADRTSR